jgi:hypothetical protein
VVAEAPHVRIVQYPGCCQFVRCEVEVELTLSAGASAPVVLQRTAQYGLRREDDEALLRLVIRDNIRV